MNDEVSLRTSEIAGIVTQHHKADYIQSELCQQLGWQLTTLSNFDTDSLGTFSGETERTMSPHECAIAKAKQALVDASVTIGLGSEGSFVPDPWGMMTINHELLACVDTNANLIAVGYAAAPVNIDILEIRLNDLLSFETKIDQFIEAIPAKQAAIVAVQGRNGKVIKAIKGLFDANQIRQAIITLSNSPNATTIELCYDLRAMNCPQRQRTIAAAARDLAKRLQALCPQCGAMDFVDEHKVSGLPCETCLLPTSVTKATNAICGKCEFTRTTQVEQKFAPTMRCDFCNP